MARSSIAVVVPAHNEGDRIEAVVSAAARHLPVLVVDDGSTDDTAVRATAAGAAVLTLMAAARSGNPYYFAPGYVLAIPPALWAVRQARPCP